MGFFRKSVRKSLELSEIDVQKTGEIQKELENKNFERAMEMTLDRIENCKDKDPYAEAHYCHLACDVLMQKHRPKIPPSECDRAKTLLNRSVEIYTSMEKDKRIHMMKAATYLKLASWSLNNGQDEEGLREVQQGLQISRQHRFDMKHDVYESTIEAGSRILFDLQLLKKTARALSKLNASASSLKLKHDGRVNL